MSQFGFRPARELPPRHLVAIVANTLEHASDEHLSHGQWLRRAFAVLAVARLNAAKDKRFRWLYDPDRGVFRESVLAALGKIDGDETIVKAASVICERKMMYDEALAYIRRGRLAMPRAHDWAERLAKYLSMAIDDFMFCHPTMPPGPIKTAFLYAREHAGPRHHSVFQHEAMRLWDDKGDDQNDATGT